MRSPIILAVSLLLYPATALPDTIHVPVDHPTIQEAIDVAVDGDIVLVAPGTYMENIDFLGKAISIISELGPQVTMIDGNSGCVVTCQSGEDEDSVIDGFTIANGSEGMYNNSSRPTIINCTFSDNWTLSGGGMFNNYSSPTVIKCVFSGNVAEFAGGMYNFSSSPTVIDCIFSDNSAWFYFGGHGGGMYNYYSSPVVTNCIFSGNSAHDDGGGMYNEFSSPTVTNCTFSGNSANLGGGMFNYTSISRSANCIFWNDIPDEIHDDGGFPTVTFSCIQGGHPGTGNIADDPLFNDPLNADFRLTCSSPCIDAGYNDAPSIPTADFEGDPRIFLWNGTGLHPVGSPPQSAIVDMGVDEYCILKPRFFK